MERLTIPNNILLDKVAELIANGRRVTIIGKGNSMMPFIINERDSITLSRIDKLNKFDIVLAKLKDNSYVIHRIIKIEGDRVILMGDGNLYYKEECTISDILAKAEIIIRRGRHINCNKKTERIKAIIWFYLSPIRRYLLAIYKRIN
jgi:Peptidase S24-like.